MGLTKTLLEITNDMQALDDLLDELGGDISDPRVATAIEEWTAELDSDLEGKVDNYAAYIRHLEERADARQEESNKIRLMAKSDNDRAGFLRNRLLVALEMRNRPKVETLRFRVSIAKNPPSVVVNCEPMLLPAEFRRTIPAQVEADKVALKAALNEGKHIEGVAWAIPTLRLNIR